MGYHVPILYDNDNIIITETREVYYKTGSGKSWESKPRETEVEVIDARYYNNIMESRYFFKSRLVWGYTLAGYLPVKESSISPDGNIKIVRKFNFERV